jgi:hypothetical protein
MASTEFDLNFDILLSAPLPHVLHAKQGLMREYKTAGQSNIAGLG